MKSEITYQKMQEIGLTYMTDIALAKVRGLAEKYPVGVKADSVDIVMAGSEDFFDLSEKVMAIVAYHKGQDFSETVVLDKLESIVGINFSS